MARKLVSIISYYYPVVKFIGIKSYNGIFKASGTYMFVCHNNYYFMEMSDPVFCNLAVVTSFSNNTDIPEKASFRRLPFHSCR